MASCVGKIKNTKRKRTRGKAVRFSEHTQTKQFVIRIVVLLLFFRDLYQKLDKQQTTKNK
jgi:hypothetical protein|tara:strand:- start:48 stop:227 length:180 start_codon:yes stop_codon:yes gene_type:complete